MIFDILGQVTCLALVDSEILRVEVFVMFRQKSLSTAFFLQVKGKFFDCCCCFCFINVVFIF